MWQVLPRDTLNKHQSFATLVAKMTGGAEASFLTIKRVRGQGSCLAKLRQQLCLQGSLVTSRVPPSAPFLVLPLSSDPPKPPRSPWVPVHSLCFHPLDRISHGANRFNFGEVQFINFFLLWTMLFVSYPRAPHQAPGPKGFLLRCLLQNFRIFFFFFYI